MPGRAKPTSKAKENKPFQKQNVVSFYCVGKLRGQELLGRIESEKRDDNDSKIADREEGGGAGCCRA